MICLKSNYVHHEKVGHPRPSQCSNVSAKYFENKKFCITFSLWHQQHFVPARRVP